MMLQQTLFYEQEHHLLPPRSIWKLSRKGIYLGTSGYSYEDWIGPFYPDSTRKSGMLSYYQSFFPVVEINYTYYNMPQPSTLFQIRNKAPYMRFSVKAHKSITHERRATRQDWQYFSDAMMVLIDTDQLASVLFQFPYSFKCTHENYLYLDELCDYFAPLHPVLEFRHAGWHHDATSEYARQRRIAIASVDAPDLPGLTSNIVHPENLLSYYRLHGRNARNWFDGDNVTRYDYTYSDAEIREIVANILALARLSDTVYVFANNHPRAQAVETLIAIAETLESAPALETLR